MQLRFKAATAISSALTLFLFAAILMCMTGCGSEDLDRYRSEVAELNEAVSTKLSGIFESSEGGDNGDESPNSPDVVTALEEAAEALTEAHGELQGIKVPAGWEDFHRGLLDLYQANAGAYEELYAALNPEAEAADEYEGQSHEQSGEEEQPQSGEEHEETGGSEEGH